MMLFLFNVQLRNKYDDDDDDDDVCKQVAQGCNAAAGIRTTTCWVQVRLPNYYEPTEPHSSLGSRFFFYQLSVTFLGHSMTTT